MDIHLNTDTVDLRHAQVLCLDDAAGMRVVCLRGCIWITQDGDVRDVVLEPGDDFVLDRDGRALATALRASGVRIEGAPAPRKDTAAATLRRFAAAAARGWRPATVVLGVAEG